MYFGIIYQIGKLAVRATVLAIWLHKLDQQNAQKTTNAVQNQSYCLQQFSDADNGFAKNLNIIPCIL